ncbi:MAG: redox-sensitive bicupin YhaK (pirin superfamily) [Myxococcota bacterium]|jgi:redox-sensitive bicupin YhaK (pirin superfamily)
MPEITVTPLGFPWPTPDPFLFCAYHLDSYPVGKPDMTPSPSLAGRNIGSDFSRRDGWSMYHGDAIPGFPRHPHRGFETITVARKGMVDHSDSMGATARFGGGDAQWMTAGKGIVHAEMFPLRNTEADNPLELFQLWLNLPRARKMVDPYFTMFWHEDIPTHRIQDAAGKTTVVTTIAGALDGKKAPSPPPDSWASQAGSDIAVWTIDLDPGATWTLPAAPAGVARSLYFHRGDTLTAGGQTVSANHRLEVQPDLPLPLQAGAQKAEILLLQGRPIGEPVAHHGPFVMNTREELRQAFADYQRTGFGNWPWPNDAPVHAREQERFAIHADGRRDTPA